MEKGSGLGAGEEELATSSGGQGPGLGRMGGPLRPGDLRGELAEGLGGAEAWQCPGGGRVECERAAACGCQLQPHLVGVPPPSVQLTDPCLSFAAPVRVVHNPSYDPARAHLPPQHMAPPPTSLPTHQLSSFIYPAVYSFQGFTGPAQADPNVQPTPQDLGQVPHHCGHEPAPTSLPPASTAGPGPSSGRRGPSGGGRASSKRPQPSDGTGAARDSPSAAKKPFRMGPPTRSHSTSELCLEETSRRRAEMRTTPTIPAVSTDSSASRRGISALRQPTPQQQSSSELIDLTFQSDDDLSPGQDDQASVVVPSDRATVGSASVMGEEVDVLHFDENSNLPPSTGGDAESPVCVSPSAQPSEQLDRPLPPASSGSAALGTPLIAGLGAGLGSPDTGAACALSQQQQLHVAPIASPRLQPQPHSFNCPSFPVHQQAHPSHAAHSPGQACPHSQCNCHLRPRAPCSYWAARCHATLLCHHHQHVSRSNPPCPLHSPCPYPCPFQAARPPQPEEFAQHNMMPYNVQLPQHQAVPHQQVHQGHPSQGGHAELGRTEATGSPGQPRACVQTRQQAAQMRERANRPGRTGGPVTGTGRASSVPFPQASQRSAQRPGRHPHGISAAAAWPSALQTPALLSLPPTQRSHYQSQMRQLSSQREAQNQWFDQQRRQRHPAGSAGLTYAPAQPHSLISAAAAQLPHGQTLPVPVSFPDNNTAILVAAEAAANNVANYQRQLLSAPALTAAAPTPLNFFHSFPFQQPQQQRPNVGQPRPQPQQISILLSPSAQSLGQSLGQGLGQGLGVAGSLGVAAGVAAGGLGAGLGVGGSLMTASVPMQLDWNLLVGGGAGGGGQFLMQQLGELNFALGPGAEAVPTGASLATIERHTRKVAFRAEEGEEERCTVCLSDFATDDRLRALSCHHFFHVHCIDRWLTYNKKCPVCRVEVDRKPAAAATAAGPSAPGPSHPASAPLASHSPPL